MAETNEDDDIQLDTILPALTSGSRLLKARSPSHFYMRYFYLDALNMKIKYRLSRKQLFCKQVPQLDLKDIDEVREGWNSDIFNSIESIVRRKRGGSFRVGVFPFQRLEKSCCFSIVIRPLFLTLDLIASTPAVRDIWVKGLNYLVANEKNNVRDEEFRGWLKRQFRAADLSRNGSLTFSECLILLKTLNVQMDKEYAKALFKEANFRKSGGKGPEVLDMDEFIIFFKSLEARPDLKNILEGFSLPGMPVIGPNELRKFLIREQKETEVTLDECSQLIRQFEKHQSEDSDICPMPGYMSIRGFKRFMLSPRCDFVNSSIHSQVYQDMTQPLHHYYIASSHNTYLRQGQLVGESSIEAYVRALKIGCKCIEIDIWDGADGEPIVFHGYTLTTKIHLRDVLDAVHRYAFATSPYPVIISLENHCSAEQQAVAAKLFLDILKESLYVEPVTKSTKTFPSPDELKNKIILKAQKVHVPDDEFVRVTIDKDAGEGGEDVYRIEMLEEEEEVIADGNYSSRATTGHYQLSRQLSELVNLCKATRFESFQKVQENWKFYEMSSMSETVINNHLENSAKDLLEYNRRHLCRVYPSGLRTGSSNFLPNAYWAAGCQIVALNVQGYDEGGLLNKAMFMQNGTCGYVLRPNYLNSPEGTMYNPERPLETAGDTIVLTLKVISGQYIPKPGQALEGEIVDPYVSVKVYGHPKIPKETQKQKTKPVSNNGFNPVWNHEMVLEIPMSQVAVLVIQVKDHQAIGRNKRLALYAAPVQHIKQGYRHIHLWNDSFRSAIPATLFVHVNIRKIQQFI